MVTKYMFLMTFIIIYSCLIALTAVISTDFSKGLTDSGWDKSGGDITLSTIGRTGSALQLGKDAGITKTINLAPGIYELTAWVKGHGTLTIEAGGTAATPITRTLGLLDTFECYGLLFAVEGKNVTKCRLSIQLHGMDAVLDDAAITPATTEQINAWNAAQDSFTLLGYYGSDPQRPAPGRKASGNANVAFSEDNLKRWAIRDTVIFYDAGYDAHWVDNDAGVADFFTQRGLPAKNAIETETWLKDRSTGDNGVGTSIIFTMGTGPANCVYPPFADCLLARYLQAGGRVVWLANAPLYIAQATNGPKLEYGATASQKMLGLTTDKKTFYGMNGATLSQAGKAWGIEPSIMLTRPVKTASVTVPFVTDPSGDYCGIGMVTLRPDLPMSGFIFSPDALSPKQEVLLRNAYRLARYSGKTIELPAATPPPASQVPIEAILCYGATDKRMVYLRGELVPLVLRLRSLKPDIHDINVRYSLSEGDTILRQNTVTIPISQLETNQLVGYLDLEGLRVGRYTVKADLDIADKKIQLTRELRIAPQPDHRGTYIGIWCDGSPKMNRTEDLLNDIATHNLEPLFADSLSVGQDLSLWYGMSYVTRRHGQPATIINPPGYNNDRLGSDGQVMRIRAQGDKREATGYASPVRRQAEADDFQQQVASDNMFPAFRRRTMTADDYSQWFGLDYNRFAVEGFHARYGIDPSRPKGTQDAYGTVNVDRAPGIIPDDDPWILLNRYWSETLGDSGRRFSRAMEAATGGLGKVGPIPGGMIIPLVSMWSGQYPPFNFGAKNGFNLSSCYYYNNFWQPPLAHIWWLETARMGNRDLEQWMMPDCYMTALESYYRNNFWLMMAGGVQGLPYFRYQERKPEAMETLKDLGALTKRYGLLLNALRPAPKKVAMLVPFENVTYRIENGYEMAYPFMNMLLAKVDVEPVSPEELDAVSIRKYETVVLAQTKWLKAGTVKLLEDYIVTGGKVVVDSVTAAVITIKGATKLDFPIGETTITQYGLTDRISRIRNAFKQINSPVVDCADPYVTVRRAELPDGTPGVWLVHNYNQDEYAKLRAGRDNTPTDAHALEEKLGYRKETVTTTITRTEDGRIPFDVFGNHVLEAKRADGKMTVTVEISKWEGKLLLFLPSIPQELKLIGIPTETKPGLPINFGVYILNQVGKPLTTPMPLLLTLRDPQGQTNREYTHRLMTNDGKAIHSLSFATNDLRGIWTLEIENVMNGVKVSREIRLQ